MKVNKMPVVTRSKTWAAAQEQKSRDIWARYLPTEINAAPVKMDFSKMPKRPISEGFVFPKSAEQKLAEALAEIEALKRELEDKDVRMTQLRKWVAQGDNNMDRLMKENIDLKAENAALNSENAALKKKNENLEANVKYLEGEVDSWKEQYGSAVDTCKKLRERIANPFKGAISSPF